ncbi:MAG: MOSC domain-containing protein, partial [Candidatus Binatia bacterium]
RRWMLTDPSGVFFTQREFPKMATITVDVREDCVRFSAAAIAELSIPLVPENGRRQSITVWQSVCEGDVYSGDVNQWFCEVLGLDCQLVYMPDTTSRHVSERFDSGDDIVSFADGYPLMVIGAASLDELNSRLAHPVPMNRFRPNLVVSGSAAFAEDGWKLIRIGGSVFRVVKACARCVITTIDQATGESTGKDPLKTLASYRMARSVYPGKYESRGLESTGVLFGQNLIPESPGGLLRVGDDVEVVE